MANTQLSRAQVRSYAAQAGFAGAALDLIVAIAWLESRFEPGARNPSGATGILQIKTNVWSSHGATDECALNPSCAFRFAHDVIIPLQGWSAWSSVSQAQATVSSVPDPAHFDPTTGNAAEGLAVPGSGATGLPVVGGIVQGAEAIAGIPGHAVSTITGIPGAVAGGILSPIAGKVADIARAAMPYALILTAIVLLGFGAFYELSRRESTAGESSGQSTS